MLPAGDRSRHAHSWRCVPAKVGERISCGRAAGEQDTQQIINPSSYMPWLLTKGVVQIDPTKLSALISQPLITLSLSWPAPGRAVKASYSPPLNPQPCPLSLLFSLSQVVTAQASRKESNRDRSYCSAKRQEKK